MPWRDVPQPTRMQRIAVVAPRDALRDVLVQVADAGVVELDRTAADRGTESGEAGRRLRALTETPHPARLSLAAPDPAALERDRRTDLLAGEAQLEDRCREVVGPGDVAALVGWMPAAEVPRVQARLTPAGGAVAPLPRPPGSEPPTLLATSGGTGRSFVPLVETYASVPYADVDPTLLAGLAYVVMFGMMFADAGHGAVLVVAALLVRAGRPRPLARLRKVWPIIAGAGLSSTVFGLLYGEFMGPTGMIPALWLEPLDEPVSLMLVAVGAGALLLAGAYVLGTVNRWREGGARYACYASSGLAGSGLFLGLAAATAAWYLGEPWLGIAGGAVAVTGLSLTFAGLLAESDGGAAGLAQATVETFDAVVRLGSNLLSFARLAAFGLTHAALGLVVWQGTTALWEAGGLAVAGAVLVFVLGNALAFSLEALVAAIQALRLEYYELFSRVFRSQGRPFRPWHVPLEPAAVPAAVPMTAPADVPVDAEVAEVSS
jgi:V/A-type H+-transporting ATPase subunit I